MSTPSTDVPPVPAVLTGGCLCTRVRYEARPGSLEGYYCHCRMCQLAVGNTRAAFLNLRKDEVRWLTEPPAYYASSRFARRGFCGHCGTPLTFEYLDSQRMDLTVGSFDEPQRLKPVSHFAVETRIAAWHAEDGLPGTLLAEHKALLERWKTHYGAEADPGVDTVRGSGA